MIRLAAALATVVASAVGGCGGGAVFQNLFPDNDAGRLGAVLARLPRPERAAVPANALGRPVIVVSRAGDNPGLLTYAVDGGEEIWRVDLPVDSPPWLGGGTVVVKSGDELVSLSIANGEELGRRDLEGMTLLGVALDGGIVAATVGSGGGTVAATGRYGEIWIMDEDLSDRVSPIEAAKQLGAPAVSGGLVFVPWDRQMITVVDAALGAEVCRLNLRDEMVAFVVAVPEGVFFGSKGVFRLTPAAASGTKADSAYAAVEWTDPEYPGQPALYPDAFEGVTNGDPSARAKVRLAWYPGTASGDREVTFADDRLYFVYYRHVVAFRPADRTLVWVRALETPAAEVAAVPGGLWVVEQGGAVRFIAGSNGAEAWSGDVGTGVRRAGFSVAGYVPSGDAGGGSLRRQVMDTLLDPDNQAVPVRRMILTLFGRVDEADVSRDILVVLRDPAMPIEMRDAAARALRLRRDGASFLKEALADHYDYLHDVPVPPVGVIAGALMSMNERSATSALLAHLTDPSTPAGDLEELVRALVALGDSSVVTPFEKFFLMYHADSEMTLTPGSLLGAAEGILAHGGDAGERFVQSMIDDPFTPASLGNALRERFDAHRSAAPAVETRPASISRERFIAFVESSRSALDPCLADLRTRRPNVTQIDMSVTVTGGGAVVDLVTAPMDVALATCLRAKMEALQLPLFQGQQDRYVVPIVL